MYPMMITKCCCHYLPTSDGASSPFLWLLLVRRCRSCHCLSVL
ncbi:hypothetical protein Hanom_Chr09g00832631 [Helianthus anomalus]